MTASHVIGIDVGTGSARAGVFDLRGRMAGVGVKQIRMWRDEGDFVEQSSANIWRSVCAATRDAMRQAGLTGADVAGIAFDATCSLAAVDAADRPVSVSPSGSDERNIIVWMDHRAMAEAARLTAQGHEVIKYLGGTVSPEHQIPKLIWLKKNLPAQWKRTRRFFDLPDWLTYQATGRDVRSLCTTVCKWTYMGHKGPEGEWDKAFFEQNRLGDLLKEARIGVEIEPMGNCAGGLTSQAARELGLEEGTPVAVGIIDAHAGGVGVLGMGRKKGDVGDFNDVLCLIGGTSSCHMVVSAEPRFVKGVWGPYYSAMVPGLWLNEGGQSATGALLDFVIATHAAHGEAQKGAKAEGVSIYEWLNARVEALRRAEGRKLRCELTDRLHLLPYFHGNRSPNADPAARGAVHGLALHATVDDLARLYYATIQAIAYGTRDIIDALNAEGYRITKMHACGGGTKNALWMQEHADATGCEIVLPREPEAVLLGSAVLAAVGAGCFDDLPAAMGAMSAPGRRVRPDARTAMYHSRKLQVHKAMYRDQKKYDALIDA